MLKCNVKRLLDIDVIAQQILFLIRKFGGLEDKQRKGLR